MTFAKRKFGLMKKAYELSVLCECEIAVLVFNGPGKMYAFSSADIDDLVRRYTSFTEPYELRTKADMESVRQTSVRYVVF